MIEVRKTDQRQHTRRRQRDTWQTFPVRDEAAVFTGRFGSLQIFEEDRLPPGASAPHHALPDAEVITYVREGALVLEDSLGRSDVVHAGEFHHLTVGRQNRHSETNVSRSEWAHVFRIWLSSELELEASQEQARFTVAERRGRLCVTASPDARGGSLRLRQDVLLYSALLEPGQHIVHELAPGRSAWLHLVRGRATFCEGELNGGDGVGVTGERGISLTARGRTELLLLELGEASGAPRVGGESPRLRTDAND